MNLRPNHPVGQALGRLAEQVRAVPADDPRYVVGIMADNPQRTAEGQPGTTMAPLFHNIAAWLLQRENVPLSADPGPMLTLQAD